jgi:hypothetical protein
MRRLLTTLLLAAAVALGSFPAQAGGYYKYKSYGYYGHHHAFKGHRHKHFKRHYHARPYHYRHHHKHRSRVGDEILIGAGIIGGAIVLGSVLSRPAPPPPPVYYQPQRAPNCVQDQVYRSLPDGSLQWGTRTRCY